MKTHVILIFLATFLAQKVKSEPEVTVSDKSVIVKEGSEVNLKCFLNDTLEALGCSFVSPSPASKNYNMLQGAAYDQVCQLNFWDFRYNFSNF